jgi:hypothetical protein
MVAIQTVVIIISSSKSYTIKLIWKISKYSWSVVKSINSPSVNCNTKEKSKYLLFKIYLILEKLYNIYVYGL